MNEAKARRVAQELQLLHSAQTRSVRFHGSSLHPFLQDGDAVIVEPVRWDDIRAGDLITYRCEGKYPTRRAIRKRGDRLLLGCDNWPVQRFIAHRADVLGRAVAREREGKPLRCEEAEWQEMAARALATLRCSWPLSFREKVRGKIASLIRGRVPRRRGNRR